MLADPLPPPAPARESAPWALTPLRILLVDDQPIVRRCLRLRLELEADLLVVGETGDGTSALALARDHRPDVVVIDIARPLAAGLALTADVRALLPVATIIVHSLRDDATTRAQALAAGATAIVGKHALEAPLLDAIRATRLEQ